jgi:PD-(D/E)XK nuclease superfamily protein
VFLVTDRDRGAQPSKEVLEAAHCWENDDRVPGRPAMTAFRRRVRLHQARWREAHGHPIGTQPIVPRDGKPWRFVGSRLPLDYARETGANFVNASALNAVKARLATTEPQQSVDMQRLWADLLWALAMCVNVFGDLGADHTLADRAIHTWWPDAPGTVSDVRFEHSPGWLDPAYLGNLSSFDAAFELDLGHGTYGIIGVETKYHDRLKREVPKQTRLPHYVAIAKRSGVFGRDALDAVNGTDLLVMWLDHLLLHSMLQHPSGRWRWGRLVVLHPAGNTDYVDACNRYRSLLTDTSTFAPMTLEHLLASGALRPRTAAALRTRYAVD